MIGRLNHVAVAVPDLAAAAARYRDALGARVSPPQALPEHGVTVAFVELPNTKIELLEPLGAASPIAKFLEKNPDGGMHHLCFEVDDIVTARDALKASGARVLGDGEPKIGAHGKPVLFLHPKDFTGDADRARTGVGAVSRRPTAGRNWRAPGLRTAPPASACDRPEARRKAAQEIRGDRRRTARR